ncbi:hypothetical protein DEO72_LG9g1045 [Vigna unguiculata]|uniref:Uncharacterized protein n=1 Tax=Vigna unguiculata TaxID=3917 RepID=A0A4D6MX53_VIGUN|nr:hypothetical protein DEO72_LG9g1045 [Vigna unguiculata]
MANHITLSVSHNHEYNNVNLFRSSVAICPKRCPNQAPQGKPFALYMQIPTNPFFHHDPPKDAASDPKPSSTLTTRERLTTKKDTISLSEPRHEKPQQLLTILMLAKHHCLREIP